MNDSPHDQPSDDQPIDDADVLHAEDITAMDERRRTRGAVIAAGAFLVILLAIVLVQAAMSDDGDGDDTTAGGAADDALAIDFEMLDGSTVALADHAGTPLVVNFFASWCAPCINEMPAFESVHQELGDTVRFIGINVQDQADDLTDLLDRTGITYEVGLDPRGDLVTAFGGTAMPTTVLVTADGRIADRHTGELSAEDLRALIDAELTS